MPSVTLDQAAQSQDRLTAMVCPAHTRAFQTLRDQGLATGFHHTTGNRKVQTKVFGVVHARLLIAEVGQYDYLQKTRGASGAGRRCRLFLHLPELFAEEQRAI
jgi:hypothetical protein